MPTTTAAYLLRPSRPAARRRASDWALAREIGGPRRAPPRGGFVLKMKHMKNESFRPGTRPLRGLAAAWVQLAAGMVVLGGAGLSAASGGPANLLQNGDWEQTDAQGAPAAWRAGPGAGAESACRITADAPHSGRRCAVIERTGSGAEHFSWRQSVTLQPGELYRLNFLIRAEGRALDTAAVCLAAQGEEGPAWLLKRIVIAAPMQWQPVEFLFRAQSGLNPLARADLEFRLYQWRRGRPEEQITQRLWIDDVSLEPISTTEAAVVRIGRWLLVPTHPNLRYADVELGLGDGIAAEDASMMLRRDGRQLQRVAFLDELRRPDQFAYSARTRRVYVTRDGAVGSAEVRFRPRVEAGAGACLGIADPDSGRALRAGRPGVQRVPLEIAEPGAVDRVRWPVTQGLPLPRGAAADVAELRVLDPSGQEIPAQIRATSFWEDDSLRWVLLDFQVNLRAGQRATYAVECGAGIKRAAVPDPVRVQEDEKSIFVDTGSLRFRVSRENFRLFEDVVAGSARPLAGAPTLKVTEDNGREFTTHAGKPYHVAVEEAGPMRVVIVATGWHADGPGERFLTYTTRLHAYRGQRFVRVFHTLTNRHEQNVMGRYRYADGFPEEESRHRYREIPQRNVVDAAIQLPLADGQSWQMAGSDPPLDGPLGPVAVVHRQAQRAAGTLTTAAGGRATGGLPGAVQVAGKDWAVTAAVFRYADLFPKELRLSSAGLELGLMPFSPQAPHGLIKGTACTTELLFAFTGRDSAEGMALARAFAEPLVFTNAAWYCASRGFLNDELVPASPITSGTYDRIMASFAENARQPYAPGVDDCGLMNFGDWPYTGRGVWVNLEYDADLGLYIHFVRTGDRGAFLRGRDASRHFLDRDTGWYTGDFRTQGANFPHNVAHFYPTGPAGHTYTLGLIHYYLLTGDRRALEATRLNADACHRVLAPSVAPATSLFDAQRPVAVPRGYVLPGGGGINSRNCSDPARYSLHAYQATGEPRFLETALTIGESLVFQWPEAWRGDDDSYIHYRWPIVLSYLHEMTGAKHFRETLLKCAAWTLDEPYRRYGEFRVAQSYAKGPQLPDRTNNTRLLFQTIDAYELTGERRYLDWLLNMYDAQIEAHRDGPFEIFRDGKSLGKYADNLARALALIAPHRMVMVDPSPGRFELVPPKADKWQISLANRCEAPVDGTIEVGPLPPGMEMESQRRFRLELGEEQRFEFPVAFTDALPAGRTIVPYVVRTASGGREGERRGFFAIHALRPRAESLPRLLFHAPLDDDTPATAATGGPLRAVLEDAAFVPGRHGRALGAATEAWSFNLGGNIRADEGTFAVWVRIADHNVASEEHGLLRVRGHGYPFIGIFTDFLMVSGQPHRFKLNRDANGRAANRWRHVALTWDLREVAFYVDGVPLNRQPRHSLEIPTGELWALPQKTAAFDDVRLYSVALPLEEIQALGR